MTCDRCGRPLDEAEGSRCLKCTDEARKDGGFKATVVAVAAVLVAGVAWMLGKVRGQA